MCDFILRPLPTPGQLLSYWRTTPIARLWPPGQTLGGLNGLILYYEKPGLQRIGTLRGSWWALCFFLSLIPFPRQCCNTTLASQGILYQPESKHSFSSLFRHHHACAHKQSYNTSHSQIWGKGKLDSNVILRYTTPTQEALYLLDLIQDTHLVC